MCMTLGAEGCIYVNRDMVSMNKGGVAYIPSYEVKLPVDTVGAGDTFLSAFSCAAAAGADGYEAASIANMAAETTIKKIGITGTATAEEIIKRHDEISSSACEREYS